MADLTLTQVIAGVTEVGTYLITLIGQGIELFTAHPVLLLFVGTGFTAIGIRYGIRMLKAAKKMA